MPKPPKIQLAFEELPRRCRHLKPVDIGSAQSRQIDAQRLDIGLYLVGDVFPAHFVERIRFAFHERNGMARPLQFQRTYQTSQSSANDDHILHSLSTVNFAKVLNFGKVWPTRVHLPYANYHQ